MVDFKTGFRGNVNGSVQSAITDQPGVGVPGMVMFASDLNMVDAYPVGETAGIAAGKGVQLIHSEEYAYNLQHPNKAAYLPNGGESAVKFGGIMIFDEQCQSDENGVPGWANGRMAGIMRPVRSGGRVWVKAVKAITLHDTVNWVIVAPTDASYEVGEFSPTALGGGSAGTSVVLPHLTWVVPAAAGGLAGIEMVGVLTATVPVNSSSI